MTNKTKKLVMTSLVAAIYAVLTLVLGAISYGPIQFRIAEIMVLLAFIKKDYIWGLTIGCFLANVIGPLGLLI
ncbi:queT transporter family protein [[Clostridium] sordellii ATCC 9714]|nr:queT transporter family protein [[Clostridium] sordellii ATCC 9714] [Paeniclostridium sordellii ATCC 9714]